MSRISSGLANAEHIEERAARARMIENARRNVIRREMQAAQHEPFEFTARGFWACVAVASAAAAFAAFTSI